MNRPNKPGKYSVRDNDGDFIGFYNVIYNPASGLMCKELKAGGSIHCPGFSDWNENYSSWIEVV